VNNLKITELLSKFKDGSIDINTAVQSLSGNSGHCNESDLFARIDHSRTDRCGFPEFVYGAGKNFDQLNSIIGEINKNGDSVLVTRLSEELYIQLKEHHDSIEYDKLSKTLILNDGKIKAPKIGNIAIITAGTSDIPVALEAKHTIELCGYDVDTLFDVGVAGIHRLLSNIDRIRKADVIVCVAGMEGALPSVIAGLVSCSVIAVPTSVGYGASLNGLTAMFAMLNSCANGVLVVNIDNGFGAGCAAVRMANTLNK